MTTAPAMVKGTGKVLGVDTAVMTVWLGVNMQSVPLEV